MRPIKFRAWDIEMKRWCGTKELTWCILPNPEVGDTGIFELDESNWEKDSAYNLGTTYILEQFTGLKDRNGVEIYEGDIVKTEFNYPKESESYKIEWGGYWNYSGFGISGKRKNREPLETEYVWDILNPNYTKEIEVIGNIHENPDLIS